MKHKDLWGKRARKRIKEREEGETVVRVKEEAVPLLPSVPYRHHLACLLSSQKSLSPGLKLKDREVAEPEL